MLAMAYPRSYAFGIASLAILACTSAYVTTPSALLQSRSKFALSTTRVAMQGAPSLSMSENTGMGRRGFGTLAAGFLLGLAAPNPTGVSPAQAESKIPSFIIDAQKGLDGYQKLDNGLMIKDVVQGLGVAPKENDIVRLQFAAYLKDGTLLSRYEGIETKFTLGEHKVPAGLEDGIRGMKVSGERLIVVPPELGWTARYRTTSVATMRGCENEGTCPFNSEPVVVRVVLAGYKKGECAGGDMPVAFDTSKLSEGKVKVSIGSAVCPEGDTEITGQRLKNLAMIDKLKQDGRLTAEKKQFGSN